MTRLFKVIVSDKEIDLLIDRRRIDILLTEVIAFHNLIRSCAAIFLDSFYELTKDLDDNDILKEKLVTSTYVRDYAFTNQFEFLAVIIETFIETPNEFRAQFPEIYGQVKRMLNFNFAGY